MREIALSPHGVALVDDEDYERLSAYKWILRKNGYALRAYGPKHSRKYEYLHRAVMGAGRDDRIIDHINRDKLDCRKANLRFTDKSLNAHNSDKTWAKAGHRGVSAKAHKFMFRIKINGAIHRQFGFADALSAANARRECALSHGVVVP